MMDDEEQEELRCTGSDVEIEEYTDTEESPYVAYQAGGDKLFDTDRENWQKLRFLGTLVSVAISVTVLVITYPLYLESVAVVSSAYTGLLFTALCSACILGMVYFVADKVSPPPPLIPNSMRVRISRCGLIKISTLYALSGILVTLSLDRNRVLCHLQDPIKGITLVFSLVYYFFFCRKMFSVMSLQRIFSSTTIIVGLFISVDYGLCDEFRCRGREVSSHTTVATRGSWGVRAVWTFVYVGALASFAMFFTLLERHYTTGQQNVCHMLTTQHNSFLYTVSRLVSSRDIRRRGSEEEGGRLLHVTDPDPTIKPKSYPKPPVMQTLFYIHVIAFFAILTFCWLDTLPGIGRGLSPVELYRTIEQGLTCHFKGGKMCSNVSSHGWTFLFAYIVFSISILNFLSLCESAVFSVATATVSLPLSGIWWSIYRMDVDLHGGSISWSPGVTGELICALLGLPVVLLGLGLLVRSHFRDTQLPYQTIQPPDIQPHEPCHR
ncbi:uncharacterized protein LOC105258715 isoform X1 [Camponotus floridanus]|uniref:uncharacterized protein LOC105258715 isoform X1 n=1 Tax=Camponotus floridanus TaxID=104421 RepID=UPI000DC6C0C7|nr:uncharacterized protein LOC105258715 isoform X1 [Camponotus floridanus]XP_025261759.1 uncharacterized protein LOC105258715 isoform X1 [Camponotus floridanus]XP_025261760.1 uncharacterized protein LOC105258715 isoform X1 [Camponotus floridanus]